MKRFISSAALIMTGLLLSAQATMNVYQTNGSILLLTLTSIDSVTFNVTPPPPLMLIHQTSGSELSLVVSDIDSITYSIGGDDGTPLIATLPVTSLTSTTAQCGGFISDQGGSAVFARGVCWSTSPYPTTSDNVSLSGSGVGTFSSSLTGLIPDVMYYVRAYAINGQGVAYGNLVSFMTSAPSGQPALVTDSVYLINACRAAARGTIISDGGETIVQKGFCWSTNPNPTTADNLTNNGAGNATYSSVIDPLTSLTTYYLRAYATNSNGTGYGNEISFTTTDGLPVVTTTSVSNIDFSTFIIYADSGVATGMGNVYSDNCLSITERGICFSTSPNPSVSDSVAFAVSNVNYSVQLTGLLPVTEYYVRAFATNSTGTYYGDEVTFTTPLVIPLAPGAGVLDNQGNSYGSVVYGNGQEWTTENLRTTTYANGDPIPNVVADVDWDVLTTGAWCYPENDAQYDVPYGKLYNWYTVTDPRNICPTGWHASTGSDWANLAYYYSTLPFGGVLKATGTEYWNAPNTGATNESGFSALPSGPRFLWGVGDGYFISVGTSVRYWSPSGVSAEPNAANRLLGSGSADAIMTSMFKASGLSVRCVRD